MKFLGRSAEDLLKIRDALASRVEYDLRAYPEVDSPEGYFSAPEDAAAVRSRIAAGGDWAWCTVEIRASWNGLVATDSLGACSYDSEDDFIENSGYIESLKGLALDNLVLMVHRDRHALRALGLLSVWEHRDSNVVYLDGRPVFYLKRNDLYTSIPGKTLEDVGDRIIELLNQYGLDG